MRKMMIMRYRYRCFSNGWDVTYDWREVGLAFVYTKARKFKNQPPGCFIQLGPFRFEYGNHI